MLVGSNVIIIILFIVNEIKKHRNRPRYKKERKQYLSTRAKIKAQKKEKPKKRRKKIIRSIICENPLCQRPNYLYFDKCKEHLMKEGIIKEDS